MSTFGTWISEWVETLRIAPPFSRRRRDILQASRDWDNPDAWVEVGRPQHASWCAVTLGYNTCCCLGHDEREPGEKFCATCPDHEACMTGYPCSLVKKTAGGVHERNLRFLKHEAERPMRGHDADGTCCRLAEEGKG